MAACESNDEINFHMLILQLAREISRDQLHFMKKFLQGHVTKETIDNANDAQELLLQLQVRKLITPSKLMFLKKTIMATNNGDKLLQIIETYEENKEKFMKRDSLKEKISLKVEGLRIMQTRQMETAEECEQSIQKYVIEYETQNNVKNKLMQEITEIKQNIQEIRDEKSVLLKDCLNIFEQCKKKTNQINETKDNLKIIIDNEKTCKNEIEEIVEKLKETGKSRLNAFDKALHKEEKRKKEEVIRELNDERCFAKQIIIDKKIDLKLLINKKVTMVTKITKLDSTIQKLFERLLAMNKNIESVENEIYLTNNNINQKKLEKVKIDEVLQNMQDKINLAKQAKRIKKRVSDITSDGLDKEGKQDFDYELMRSRCTTIGKEGNSTTKLHFKFPKALAVTSQNEIWVHDSGNKRIVLCNIQGELITIINTGKAFTPVDITVNNQDQMIAASDRLIRIYNIKTIVYQFLPHYEPKRHKLPSIYSIDFDHSKNILMALDKANLSVQMFSNEGDFIDLIYIDRFTETPGKLKCFIDNSFLLTDKNGHCIHYIEEKANGTLQCETFGGYGCGVNEFTTPMGICYDFNKNIIVVDNQNCRIKVMDVSGNCVVVTGFIGHDIGSFQYPHDVVTTSNQKIIVSDTGNHRLVVYY